MEIKIQNLGKTYTGGIRALHDVNLEIGNGMFGLLGPNGAGKTTLMRIIATLLPPTEGSVLINGVSVQEKPGEIRRLLGYLPQSFNVYPQLSVWEFLDYLALLSGLGESRVECVEAVLGQVNLTEQRNLRTKKLSGGMKRRLGIAQALLNDPQLLIVDEPTAGLDPEERVRFRNLLSAISGDRVVILSTHIVEDVASTCNDVAVIHKGQILFRGTPTDLTKRAKGKVWTLTVSQEERARLQEQHRVLSVVHTAEGWQVRLLSDESPVPQANSTQPTIEDGYMHLMRIQEEVR